MACGYLTEADANRLIELCAAIGRMLAGMSAKVDTFCGPYEYKVSEREEEYGDLPEWTFEMETT